MSGGAWPPLPGGLSLPTAVPSLPGGLSLPTGIPSLPGGLPRLPQSALNFAGSAASRVGLGSQFSKLTEALGIATDPTVDPEVDDGTLTESGSIIHKPVSFTDKYFSLVYVNKDDVPEYQKDAQNHLRYISIGSLLLLSVLGGTYAAISK
jgi:hypothetical protein